MPIRTIGSGQVLEEFLAADGSLSSAEPPNQHCDCIAENPIHVGSQRCQLVCGPQMPAETEPMSAGNGLDFLFGNPAPPDPRWLALSQPAPAAILFLAQLATPFPNSRCATEVLWKTALIRARFFHNAASLIESAPVDPAVEQNGSNECPMPF